MATQGDILSYFDIPRPKDAEILGPLGQGWGDRLPQILIKRKNQPSGRELMV